jgi:hypothetical protein
MSAQRILVVDGVTYRRIDHVEGSFAY